MAPWDFDTDENELHESSAIGKATDSTVTLGRRASAEVKMKAGFRGKIRQVLMSQRFDLFIGLVIVANSISIGIEVEQSVKGSELAFLVTLEHMFISFYTLELGARFFVDRCEACKDGWVLFDALLVGAGVMGWIIELLSESGDQLGPVTVLRIFRLLRLVRAVKLLLCFHELWMLARGLIHSMPIMVYTMVMIICMLYIFSCIALEVITKHSLVGDDRDFQQNVEKHFPDLLTTMASLVQFVSADSMASIYFPLVEKDGRLMIYFGAVILVVSIVLTNLITAVVVNSALQSAVEDGEYQQQKISQEKKQLVKKMKQFFEAIDDDDSGTITLNELKTTPESERALFKNLLPTHNVEEVFKVLDMDGSGEVDLAEFCEGVWRLSNGETSIPEMQMKQLLNGISDHLEVRLGRDQGLMMEKLEDTRRLVMQLLGERSDSPLASKNGSTDMPAWAHRMMQHFSVHTSSIHALLAQILQPTCLPTTQQIVLPKAGMDGITRPGCFGVELRSDRAEYFEGEKVIVPIGITPEGGYVKHVQVGSQAHVLGVDPGWKMKAVDGLKCEAGNISLDQDSRFDSKDKAHEVVFVNRAMPAWAEHLSDQLMHDVKRMMTSVLEVLSNIPRAGTALDRLRLHQNMHEAQAHLGLPRTPHLPMPVVVSSPSPRPAHARRTNAAAHGELRPLDFEVKSDCSDTCRIRECDMLVHTH